MAYDRYEQRRGWRDPRSRFGDEDRFSERGFRTDRFDRDRFERDREERGWFERAGDEIASWFGDEDAERRRRMEERGEGRRWPGDDDAQRFDRPRYRDEGYRRPYTGRSEARFGREPERIGGRDDRRDFTGAASGIHDPHYSEWRRRHVSELDRDYDEYRRENQARFEDEFSNWRTQRQSKRQMLGQVREHMEVVGSDDAHVGKVDRVAGDRIILAKNDPEADGAHHSLSCSALDRVEGERVVLGCTADQARAQWRNDQTERALNEREDQGEAGPHILNRSFSGTY